MHVTGALDSECLEDPATEGEAVPALGDGLRFGCLLFLCRCLFSLRSSGAKDSSYLLKRGLCTSSGSFCRIG